MGWDIFLWSGMGRNSGASSVTNGPQLSIYLSVFDRTCRLKTLYNHSTSTGT